MPNQPRWLRSAIAASAEGAPAMPWQRRSVASPATDRLPTRTLQAPQPAPPIKAVG